MKIVVKHKQLVGYSEKKVPPILYLQIWDDDKFSRNDFLGAVDLPLSYLPEPEAEKKRFLSWKKETAKEINLFKKKEIKGWFQCKGLNKKKTVEDVGRIELELQILTLEEASAMPAGKGRNPPNPLPPPK